MGFLEWLRTFDRDPAYVSINYHGRKVHKSKTGGCISLIFIIAVIIIFSYKFYSMFKQENTIFETRIGKDDFDAINLWDSRIRISVKFQNGTFIPCSKLAEFNLEPVFFWKEITDKNGKQLNGSYKLNPCLSLSSLQQQIVQFCIDGDYQKGLEKVYGRTDVVNILADREINQQKPIYRQFSIRIRQINIEKTHQPTQTSFLFIPVLKFNNHVINQQQRQISRAIYDIQQRIFLTNQPLTLSETQNIVEYTFQIKKVIMITDYSVMPEVLQEFLPFTKKSTVVESWFYGEEFTSETYGKVQDKSDIFVACFKRSMYSNTYIRHFAKLDTVLAQSFALTGVLSMITICIYKGYNSWSLQKQNIYEQNHQSQNLKHMSQNINLCSFYKHQIKSLCIFIADTLINCLKFLRCYNCLTCLSKKICCCINKQKQIQQQTQSILKRKMLQEELDMYRSKRQLNYLRKKIQILSKALSKLSQKNPQIKPIINGNQNIRLSRGYQFTPSFLETMSENNTNQLQTILTKNDSESF